MTDQTHAQRAEALDQLADNETTDGEEYHRLRAEAEAERRLAEQEIIIEDDDELQVQLHLVLVVNVDKDDTFTFTLEGPDTAPVDADESAFDPNTDQWRGLTDHEIGIAMEAEQRASALLDPRQPTFVEWQPDDEPRSWFVDATPEQAAEIAAWLKEWHGDEDPYSGPVVPISFDQFKAEVMDEEVAVQAEIDRIFPEKENA